MSDTPEPLDRAQLRERTIRGGAMTLSAQGLRLLIKLTSTVILARLIEPSAFGILAMVAAVTGFANLFRDLGLSSAAIQRKHLTHGQQSNLFWINVLTGLVLSLLFAAASPLIAWFYEEPVLALVSICLAPTFFINSLSTQHGAMLVRKMQFGKNMYSTVAGAAVTLAVSVILAFQGLSYWALVWGNLAGAAVLTVLLVVLSGFRPSLPRRGGGLRSLVRYGANVTTFDVVNYFHRNLDNVLIGKFVGPEMLGFYSRAYALLMMPIGLIRGPINAVGFPALSRLTEEPDEYRFYVRNITGLIAVLSMPIVAFMGISSFWLVPWLLGPGWEESAVLFAILSVTAFFQPVSSVRGQVMLSQGASGKYLRWGVVNAVLTSFAFVAGLPWGGRGVAAGYAIMSTILLIPSMVYAFKGTSLVLRDFLQPLVLPCAGSLGAACVLWIASQWEVWPDKLVVKLICEPIIFGCVFLGIMVSRKAGRKVISGFVQAARFGLTPRGER